MRKTQHAVARQQQRCIPPLIVEWLLCYGRRDTSFGATKIWFDRQAKKELAGDVGSRAVAHLAKFLNAAVVVDPVDDTIITVQWSH